MDERTALSKEIGKSPSLLINGAESSPKVMLFITLGVFFHDVQGLIDLMGGDKAFINKLDTVFTMPPLFDNSYTALLSMRLGKCKS